MMNVAFDPWIPVVYLDGRKKPYASIIDIFTEGSLIADLAVRPHERVAVMRLLLCVAHAALDGPKTLDDWEEVPEKLPVAAKKYLEDWNRKGVFELFDKNKPFLQVAELEPVPLKKKKNKDENDEEESGWGKISKLDFSLSSGAASTLFDQRAEKENPRTFHESKLPLMMITFQNFATRGLTPQCLWNKDITEKSAKDAPCISAAMYHTFLRGKNIFETVHLNILSKADLNNHYIPFGNSWFGRPIWEKMPATKTETESTRTFLGRLVPFSRAMKISSDCSTFLLGEGLRYQPFPESPREISASELVIKTRKKIERFLVGAHAEKQIWRELTAILQYNLTEIIGRPLVLSNVIESKSFDIWVGALIPKPGKQDIIDNVESNFHIFEEMRKTTGFEVYRKEVDRSDKIASNLGKALSTYRYALDPTGETKVGAGAFQHYWTTVENNLLLLRKHIEALNTNDFETAGKAWHAMLYKSARGAYSLVCSRETPRQIRAFALGWQKLNGTSEKNNKDNENSNKQKEENE
ncbi:MAG TPA: type I-E CRISPR-associated protein Cse1/CasA [Fibrobacteres bacterium]|jgi:CRISPR system Cascade subunit CasA|nr:type I-E CRISPR-associated protein Cse1/CasA [Fibrobacterota bacterium]